MDKAEWIERFVKAWEHTDPDPEDVNPNLVAEYAERVWPKRSHEEPGAVAADEWERDGGGASCARC